MITEIPQWALERACEIVGRKVHHFDRMGEDNYLRQSIAAHALTIAKYEKEPVERKVLVAREAMAQQCQMPESAANYRNGCWDHAGSLHACILAIELWEEGFAK